MAENAPATITDIGIAHDDTRLLARIMTEYHAVGSKLSETFKLVQRGERSPTRLQELQRKVRGIEAKIAELRQSLVQSGHIKEEELPRDCWVPGQDLELVLLVKNGNREHRINVRRIVPDHQADISKGDIACSLWVSNCFCGAKKGHEVTCDIDGQEVVGKVTDIRRAKAA